MLDKLRQSSLTNDPSVQLQRLDMLTAAEIQSTADDDDTRALADQVTGWLTRCKNARLVEERKWYKNLDMYNGRQFTAWDTSSKKMTESPAPAGEIRIPVNFIQPIIRTEMAKTGSAHPSASVLPASNDDVDIQAAKAAEQAWEWFYDTQKFQTTAFNEANFWRAITGQGFIKTYYDNSAEDKAATAAAKRKYEQDKNVTPIDAIGPLLSSKPPAPVLGCIEAESVTPFHLHFPDLAQTDLQKQPYVLHSYTMNAHTAELVYKDFVPKGWSPTRVSSGAIVDLYRMGLEAGNPAQEDQVLVTEAWIKPKITKYLPQGGLVVIIDSRVVAMSKDGLPYDHGDFPFAMITSIPNGRFYRTSVIEPLIPLQNELNRIFAQLIKYKNLMTSPQFFYRQGSLDPTRIRPRPGVWIPVQLGMDFPQPVPLQQIPTYVMDLIDRIRTAVDDISGQHQVSRAISPGADTAASAISILREADDDYLSPTLDSIEAAVETVARHALALMVQYWDVARLIKIAGEEGTHDMQMLKGSDLTSGTDIRIDAGSALPTSKSAKLATITEWIDKGIIQPDVGLKAMEMGTLGKIFKEIQVDQDACSRENIDMRNLDIAEIQQFQAGQVEDPAEESPYELPDNPFEGLTDPALGLDGTQQAPPADPMGADPMGAAAPAGMDPMGMAAPAAPIFYPTNTYDNHPVHIDGHRRHQKSQAYKAYPQEIKDVFEAHVAEHVAKDQAAQMQQASLGMPQMPGTNAGQSPDPSYAGPTQPADPAAA